MLPRQGLGRQASQPREDEVTKNAAIGDAHLVERLKLLEDVAEAAFKYQEAEWTLRFLEEIPRLDPRWNIAIENYRESNTRLHNALAAASSNESNKSLHKELT